MLQDLPEDILVSIFSLLNPKHCIRLERVCQLFHILLQQNMEKIRKWRDFNVEIRRNNRTAVNLFSPCSRTRLLVSIHFRQRKRGLSLMPIFGSSELLGCEGLDYNSIQDSCGRTEWFSKHWIIVCSRQEYPGVLAEVLRLVHLRILIQDAKFFNINGLQMMEYSSILRGVPALSIASWSGRGMPKEILPGISISQETRWKSKNISRQVTDEQILRALELSGAQSFSLRAKNSLKKVTAKFLRSVALRHLKCLKIIGNYSNELNDDILQELYSIERLHLSGGHVTIDGILRLLRLWKMNGRTSGSFHVDFKRTLSLQTYDDIISALDEFGYYELSADAHYTFLTINEKHLYFWLHDSTFSLDADYYPDIRWV